MNGDIIPLEDGTRGGGEALRLPRVDGDTRERRNRQITARISQKTRTQQQWERG